MAKRTPPPGTPRAEEPAATPTRPDTGAKPRARARRAKSPDVSAREDTASLPPASASTVAARPTPSARRPANPPAPETESTSMASEPSPEDIRLRAYHLYLERGGGEGMEFEDWLRAERELKEHRKLG